MTNDQPGTLCRAHLVPFHRSASSPDLPWPTAVQARADVHDTDSKSAPDGAGVRSMVHFVPFHRSASAIRRLRLPKHWSNDAQATPTAMQEWAEVQDTPLSRA